MALAVIPIKNVPGEPVEPSGNELILIDNGISMQKATINDAVAPEASRIADQKIAALNLGSASKNNTEDFATSAQGMLADSAVQEADADASGFGFVLDEEDLASDSPSKLPTQHSVKTYVDARIGAGPNGDYDSVTAVQAAHIPPVLNAIRTAGYSFPGDGGGALYKRVSTEPTHAGKIQSADGAWWELVSSAPLISMFGGASGIDDTSLFQAAADCAKEIEYQVQYSEVLKSPVKYVRVPAGTWNVTSPVQSQDKIVWVLDEAAEIVGAEFLSGTIYRQGIHINSKHTGILENATSFSIRSGKNDLDEVGGVYGIKSIDAISRVGAPHSVTLQIDNDTQVDPIELTGTTYTAVSVTFTNTPDLSSVKTGATITSMGEPSMTGVVTSIDVEAKTITLAGGWRPFTGVDGDTGTPSNGTPARIDYFRKIWGQNTNVFLRDGHPTKRATGYEMGVLNYQTDAAAFAPGIDAEPSVWAFDAINLADYKATVAYIARGGGAAPFRQGYISYGNEIGFQTFKRPGNYAGTAQVGFSHETGDGTAFRSIVNGQASFQVVYNGNMEIGRQDAAQTTTIDFHSSGNINDYDARIRSTGGTAGDGQGLLAYIASAHDFQGVLRPLSDLLTSLGQQARRYLDTYSQRFRPGDGGPIWTSGPGTPEGAIAAPVGSLYTRIDGGAGSTLYIKETGSGNTGWVAK